MQPAYALQLRHLAAALLVAATAAVGALPTAIPGAEA
mgnify:CR=1 FL=1|jgi:hypothetical protein